VIALAVVCAAVAAWLWFPGDPVSRLRRCLGAPPRTRPRLDHLSPRQISALAVTVGVLLTIIFGGVMGGLAGAVVAVVIVVVARRHGQRDERVTDLALTRQAPVAAELLGAIVGAGASTVQAVDAVAAAVSSPASEHLGAVRAALQLGASPQEAIARAIRRSQESGAPLGYVLEATVEDLRREHRSAVQAAARAAGVRVVAPLALCFLPAYLVIGVVPIVASLASGIFT
jgi:pilus assembly protein TadC